MSQNEHTDTSFLRNFVETSTKDKTMIDEFHRITEDYNEQARKLAASGIPQRRAEIIQQLIENHTPRRTYKEVGLLLDGISAARVEQILRAARRRTARQEAQDAA